MRRTSGLLGLLGFVITVAGCSDEGTKPPPVDARRDTSSPDAGADTRPADAAPDLATSDAPLDAGPDSAADGSDDSPATDAGPDGAPTDGGPDVIPIVHGCGAFSTPSQWTTAAGFRSAVVAAGDPLIQPVAISFAAGAYGESAYVVDQGARALFKVDTRNGAVTTVVATAAWPRAPGLLTTSVWDAESAFDGRLYIGDQGSDGDADSVIFRVDPTGTATVFAAAPGPGLDDIYGLAFSPGVGYPAGLYVSGDTDGAGVGFGRFDAAGVGATFAMFAGVEGLAVDRLGRFGGGLFASLPAGGGYSGDDTITRINANGTKATPLKTTLPGIHALTFAPNGPFGGDLYAASWQTGEVVRITPTGVLTVLASGLSLSIYDGNVLSFSPDGRILFVADRDQRRIVCIEAAI